MSNRLHVRGGGERMSHHEIPSRMTIMYGGAPDPYGPLRGGAVTSGQHSHPSSGSCSIVSRPDRAVRNDGSGYVYARVCEPKQVIVDGAAWTAPSWCPLRSGPVTVRAPGDNRTG